MIYPKFIILILFVIAPLAVENQFFPKGCFSERDDLDQRRADWYSSQLKTLGEESIYEAREDKKLEIYRFTCLRTFNNPIAIRVGISEEDEASLNLRVTDGMGGYAPGKIIIKKEQPLIPEKIDRIREVLTTSDFASLPTVDKNFIGLDGSQWIIEALVLTNYHIVDRWTPLNGPIREIGELFLELSGYKPEEIY